jgi:hypothetical protein
MVLKIRIESTASAPSALPQKTVQVEKWVELSAAVLKQARLSRLERDLATNVLMWAGGTPKGAAHIRKLRNTNALRGAVVFDPFLRVNDRSIEGTRPPPAPGPRPPRPKAFRGSSFKPNAR